MVVASLMPSEYGEKHRCHQGAWSTPWTPSEVPADPSPPRPQSLHLLEARFCLLVTVTAWGLPKAQPAAGTGALSGI